MGALRRGTALLVLLTTAGAPWVAMTSGHLCHLLSAATCCHRAAGGHGTDHAMKRVGSLDSTTAEMDAPAVDDHQDGSVAVPSADPPPTIGRAGAPNFPGHGGTPPEGESLDGCRGNPCHLTPLHTASHGWTVATHYSRVAIRGVAAPAALVEGIDHIPLA